MFLSPEHLLRVLFVFARVSGLAFSAPVFGHKSVPVLTRVLLSALLAFVLAGFATAPLPAHALHPVGFMLIAAREVVTGLLLGYAVRFVFWAVEFAGEAIGFQMSLSLAQAYDPMSGGTVNPLGRAIGLSFLLLFVLLDGPQQVVVGLATSFDAIPLGGGQVAAGGPLLLSWTGAFFSTSVRLAMPFLVALFLADVGLGVFSRVVPQADLFSISLPLKLLAGFAIAIVFLSSLFPLAPGLFDGAAAQMREMVQALAP